MTAKTDSLEIGVLIYPGAQSAAVHGLTDLFAVANRVAAQLGAHDLPVLRVTHWQLDASAQLQVVHDSQPANGHALRALMIPPSLAATLRPRCCWPIGPRFARCTARVPCWPRYASVCFLLPAAVCWMAGWPAPTGTMPRPSANASQGAGARQPATARRRRYRYLCRADGLDRSRPAPDRALSRPQPGPRNGPLSCGRARAGAVARRVVPAAPGSWRRGCAEGAALVAGRGGPRCRPGRHGRLRGPRAAHLPASLSRRHRSAPHRVRAAGAGRPGLPLAGVHPAQRRPDCLGRRLPGPQRLSQGVPAPDRDDPSDYRRRFAVISG